MADSATMDRKHLAMIGGSLGILLLAAVLVLSPDDKEDPEIQIKATLDRLEQAASAKDVDRLMESFSDDFKSPVASSKPQLARVVAGWLKGSAWQRCFFVSTSIDVADDLEHADVTTGAVLTQGEDLEKVVATTSASTYKFSFSLQKESGGWRIISVSYREVRLSELLPGIHGT